MASAPQCIGSVGTAAGLGSAAPFIGVEHLGAVVAEGGGVPVGVVGIADGVDALGVDGVGDVEQDSVTGAGAGGEADGGIDGDVVALVGGGGRLRAFAVRTAFPEAIHVAGLRVGEDARAGDDLGQLGVSEGYLDDVDAEERGLRVGLRVSAGAAGEFFGLTDLAGAGDVDVDVVLILGVDQKLWVCDPRQLCTAATCLGLVMSLISKMRTPRKRSGLGGAGRRPPRPAAAAPAAPRQRPVRGRFRRGRAGGTGMPCVPQSMRPFMASADMKSRWP